MKNVVVLIEETVGIDHLGDGLTNVINLDDTVYLFVQLPKVKAESIPLIGDLSELRLHKIRNQIENWFQSIGHPSSNIVISIHDKKLNTKKIKTVLNGNSNITVFGLNSQKEKLNTLFSPLEKEKVVQYSFFRDDFRK